MATVDKYNLKWNDFESGLLSGFQDIRKSQQFFDVTLVCEESRIQAHKVVLSACSPLFRQILSEHPHPNPLVYLRGVTYENLVATLNFMYCGEVNISQDTLSDFLATAEDFKVKGLSQSSTGSNRSGRPSDPSSGTGSSSSPPGGGGGGKAAKKRAPDLIPAHHTPSHKKTKQDSQQEKAGMKREPTELIVIETPSAAAAAAAAVAEKALDIVDYGGEYGEEDEGEEEEDSFDYVDYTAEEERMMAQQGKGFSLNGTLSSKFGSGSGGGNGNGGADAALLLGGAAASLKESRQQVLNFINVHKIRLENCYICDLCNKQSADNSNMNKHIEFTHATELQAFLQNLAVARGLGTIT